MKVKPNCRRCGDSLATHAKGKIHPQYDLKGCIACHFWYVVDGDGEQVGQELTVGTCGDCYKPRVGVSKGKVRGLPPGSPCQFCKTA